MQKKSKKLNASIFYVVESDNYINHKRETNTLFEVSDVIKIILSCLQTRFLFRYRFSLNMFISLQNKNCQEVLKYLFYSSIFPIKKISKVDPDQAASFASFLYRNSE